MSTPLAERRLNRRGLSLAVVVGVLAALLVFAVGFVSGGVYTVRKHQDMYCPQPPWPRAGYEFRAPDGQRIVGVRTGCRDGEDLFK